jgi:hypothetical protein
MMQEIAANREEPQRPRQRLLEDYVPEEEYCKELDVSDRKARQDRQRGIGPPFVRIGRKIYYSRNGILEWLKSLEHRPVRSGRQAA